MTFFRNLFKPKSPPKPQRSTKIVEEKEFVSIKIDKDAPHVIYTAAPLLSCFAYVFFYENKNKEQGAILYHALGGILDPLVLKEINRMLTTQDVERNTVKIVIAMCEDTWGDQVNIKIRDEGVKQLKEMKFNEDHIFSVENASFYSVDSRENPEVVLKPFISGLALKKNN